MNDENKTFCKQDGTDLKELVKAQIENILTLINANDKNYNQRFENVIQATAAALAGADRAVSKAEQASDKRFDGVNEFRATLSDQASKFIIRTEFELVVTRLEQDIKNLALARAELLPAATYSAAHKDLQNQLSATAETLRALTVSTASAITAQIDQVTSQLTDRISSLEKIQYEGQGKDKGINLSWGVMIAVAGVAIALSRLFIK